MLNGIISYLDTFAALRGFDITPFLREQGTDLPAVVVQLQDLRPAAPTQQFSSNIDRAEIRLIVLHTSTAAAFSAAKAIRDILQETRDRSLEGLVYFQFNFLRMDAGSVNELDIFTVSLDFETILEQP